MYVNATTPNSSKGLNAGVRGNCLDQCRQYDTSVSNSCEVNGYIMLSSRAYRSAGRLAKTNRPI
jgi:hypothetical protein